MKKKPQLFLLHFAGGDRNSFRFIIPFLSQFSVFPLELPGRGDRIDESLIKDMESAAHDLFQQIISKLDGSDFAIYGHSLGSTLGLRVTGLLESKGIYPTYLFVSGDEGPIKNRDKKRYLLDDKGLVKELVKFGGVSSEIISNSDFLSFYLPILRADFEIAEKDSYCNLKVKAPIFGMMGDSEENVDKITNWKNFTSSTFKYHIFTGGHFFIHNHFLDIAKIINENYIKHLFLNKQG